MGFTQINHYLSKLIILISILLITSQCNLYRKTDAREIPVNAKDRVQKNLEEGRRIKFSDLTSGGSGKFEFATANEMWRATIEILDFIPLANADYGGGIIITDWYNDGGANNESIKIMVQFLSNEVRADGLKIVVYNKICSNEAQNNCTTNIQKTGIEQELKLAILKKASEYKLISNEKEAEEYRRKNKGKPLAAEIGKGEGADKN